MEVKKGLYYSEDHEWIKVEEGVATIGITDFAQHSMGEIVYVELPMEEDELDAGDVFGVLESVKAASDSFTPVSGEVVEVNEALEDEPELINESPYDAWILKIMMSNESELKDLMSPEEYEEFCNKED
ncbi:MAG TPA: glycine cleavage system protein GcvH [Candidatus Izemoplasmatales bacterium]|nr:glycine cleavage system protein GcvH [Candidatus Izemoplasmatales bacterium]